MLSKDSLAQLAFEVNLLAHLHVRWCACKVKPQTKTASRPLFMKTIVACRCDEEEIVEHGDTNWVWLAMLWVDSRVVVEYQCSWLARIWERASFIGRAFFWRENMYWGYIHVHVTAATAARYVILPKQGKNEESTDRRIINHHHRRIGTLGPSLVFAVQGRFHASFVARFSRGS